MSARDQILARIRQLQDTAGRTDAEAEAYLAKAAKLAAEHQISQADVAGYGRREAIGQTVQTYWLGRACGGAFALFARVAEVYGCTALGWVGENLAPPDRNGHRKWKRCFRLTLCGRKSDRDLVMALVETVLLPQMMADVARDKPRSRLSYTRGWAARVGARLQEVKRDTYEATGLEVVHVADPDLDAYVANAIDGPAYVATVNAADVEAGSSAAATADIGNAKVTVENAPAQIGAGR